MGEDIRAFPSECGNGMTLRDYFMAHSPISIREWKILKELTGTAKETYTAKEIMDEMCLYRKLYADAMLQTRTNKCKG